MDNKPVIKIKSIVTVTHIKRIQIGELIEVFKAYCGAPEDASVLWPGPVPPYDKREVEIVWSEKEAVEETNEGSLLKKTSSKQNS